VLVQCAPLRELFAAAATEVGFRVVVVRSHVTLEKVGEGKPSATVVACVSLDSTVDKHVSRVRPPESEPTPARCAAVAPLHCVDRLVLGEPAPRPEVLAADPALERHLSGVRAQVQAEAGGVDEGPAAHAACVAERGVQRQVALQRLRRRKRVPALVAEELPRALRGPGVRGGVRPHVRLEPGVVLTTPLADRADARLVAGARCQVRAQRRRVAQELAAVGTHRRAAVAVHSCHVLRQLRVRPAADVALLRHAVLLPSARPRHLTHLDPVLLTGLRSLCRLQSQQRRDGVWIPPAVVADVVRQRSHQALTDGTLLWRSHFTASYTADLTLSRRPCATTSHARHRCIWNRRFFHTCGNGTITFCNHAISVNTS